MNLLKELLPGLSPDTLPDMQVSGFALDNRHIKPGMAFVALQGTQQHGICFAKDAVLAGAIVVLYEPNGVAELPALEVPLVPVTGLSEQLGIIASRFYQQPSRDLLVVGVTGTDGKTSVTHFMAEVLNALEKQSAVVGTIGIGKPGELQEATHTTPDAISVHKHLRTLSDVGFDAVAMEVSSHALDQGRVNAVDFDVAVLTNLTRDHLDYHGTEAAYADAKAKLFHWDGLRFAVLNLDDAFGRRLLADLDSTDCQVFGYGVGPVSAYPENTLLASNAVFDHSGITAQLTSPWGNGTLRAPVLGRFNLDNLLATVAALLSQGFELSKILSVVEQVNTVPGRMERVQTENLSNNLLVVVDYAHTPSALASVLSALKVHTQQKLICVFGCGGDRDAGKRPLMASAAEHQADVVIVTDDNPRTEIAEEIFSDIKAGFIDPSVIHFDHDRARAIRTAIGQAVSGDTVLIAGKGHETVQIVNQNYLPFDDRQQAVLALQECAA